MNTLLINLTRFGDLLQTQPVISGLAAQGHRVGLICLENFAPATSMLRHLDAVYPLPGARLLAHVDDSWHTGLGELWQWMHSVRHQSKPQMILNLTASLSARLLARYITPPEGVLRGFSLDPEGFGVNTDPWTSFLQASTRIRGCSPFNLVDLFRMSVGLGGVPCPYDLQTPTKDVRAALDEVLRQQVEHLRTTGSMTGAPAGFVALQLGASEKRRRWPVEYFARLGDMLWQHHALCPVLLGARGEASLGERYTAQATKPHINLIGQTDLPSLGAAVSACHLLVSNDTGTMHLATGLGIPVLALFLATAQPWDTGPYKEGQCSLEPDMECHPCPFNTPCPHGHACRTHIRPETVHAITAHWLKTGAWSHTPESKGTRIWRAHMQADGFMNLHSLSNHEGTERTVWVRLQRHFYRQFLDRAPANSIDVGQLRPLDAPHPSLRPNGATHNEAAAELQAADALLYLLLEQGNALRTHSADILKRRFLTTWQRLQTSWDSSTKFNALGYLWMSESQEAGGDLDTMLALATQYRALTSAWLAHLAPTT